MRRWLAALCLVPMLMSCASSPEQDVPRGPLPTYAQIRDANNERVQLLDRIWSRTVVRIDYTDEDGRRRSEQLEGHLQLVRPSRLLMTFNKLGELYFVVGSNEARYWWIRLGKDKQASVGRYDQADERTIARLELAVHPLDFIELLAITPLPDELATAPSWTPDGLVRIQMPARWGTRVLYVEPGSLEPARVEMRNSDGELVAFSTLTRYMDVEVSRSVEGPQPRLPQRFWVESPASEVSVKVDIYAPETSDRKPRAEAFDFDRIVSMYRVRDIIDLDEGG